MAELVLSDLDDVLLRKLQELARHHGRTPAEEAKAVLARTLSGPWAQVDALYHRLEESGRTFSDSADLLREDRDR